MGDSRGVLETDCASVVSPRAPTTELVQTARYEPVIEPTSEADRLRRRLNTYSQWTSKKSSLQLATAGFIYTGITDKVECQSCGIRLYNWQEDEDPLQAHKKYAPDCEFMLKNFPNVQAPPKPKKILTVKYPQYSNYETRLKSFDSWPLKCVAQKPEMMARSGFFYIGSADRARCFHCGVTLRDWDTDDYPPCAHRQWSENCPYVQQIDVDGMRKEIEEWERVEKLRIEFENSTFIDCSSSQKKTDSFVPNRSIEVDGVTEADSECGASAGPQIYTQVSDPSTDDFGLNPAVQAVVEMGYSHDMIRQAFDIRKKEGIEKPNAMQLFETIMDLEG